MSDIIGNVWHMSASLTPKHSKSEQVYQILADKIRQGLWAIGDCIPTEIELAEEFECGRGTVATAITRLEHAGVVERRKRGGTRVLRHSIETGAPMELDAFAFIYPSDLHEGLWNTVRGFQEAANRKKRPVVMLSSGLDFKREAEFLQRLSEFNVHGAVMHPVIRSSMEQTQFCQMLMATKFPVVLAGVSLPGVDCPVVITDGFDAGYTMTKHLLDGGLRRIGFFADHARTLTMRDRYQGYRWALKEARIAENPAWLYLETTMRPDYDNPFEGPTRMAAEYLAAAPEVEGVVCAHDFLAVGMILAAREIGKRVPEDLKVVGIDGHSSARRPDISLTTYEVSAEETGRKAFELLEKVIAKEKLPKREVQIKGQLVVRSSSH